MKIYLHNSNCIYPQVAFEKLDEVSLNVSENNRLKAIEPKYEGIPKGVLRRMGKAVRIGVGAALPLIADKELEGVILGTANGGMEDCVRFFNQIIDYDEGNLTPTNFVQSTTNAIASQIGLMATNKGHNNTHVHAGLAFENALIDVFIQLRHNAQGVYLVGGVDEISDYNYNIDFLGSWNKTEPTLNTELFESQTKGSIVGEGAAMFLASGVESGAQSCVRAMETLPSGDLEDVAEWQKAFVAKHFAAGLKPDLLLTGENGDIRELQFYDAVENLYPNTAVARYKHLTGEFPTANALGLWFANQILESQKVPAVMRKKGSPESIKHILIYNAYHQSQHSLMLLTKV